eukprot:3066873-Amphidinium_carterae.2
MSTLPSGHDAVYLLDGIEQFAHCRKAQEFQQGHEEVPCHVRAAQAQSSTDIQPKTKSVQFAVEHVVDESRDSSLSSSMCGRNDLGTIGGPGPQGHSRRSCRSTFPTRHHDCGPRLLTSLAQNGTTSRGSECTLKSAGSDERRDSVELKTPLRNGNPGGLRKYLPSPDLCPHLGGFNNEAMPGAIGFHARDVWPVPLAPGSAGVLPGSVTEGLLACSTSTPW